MKNVKILGISKSGSHVNVKLEKRQEFLSGFRQFLKSLGFDDYEDFVYSFGRPVDEHGEPNESEEENIENLVDEHFSFANKKYKIDVVFGKNKIFLIISTASDKQQEITENLKKFCRF